MNKTETKEAACLEFVEQYLKLRDRYSADTAMHAMIIALGIVAEEDEFDKDVVIKLLKYVFNKFSLPDDPDYIEHCVKWNIRLHFPDP